MTVQLKRVQDNFTFYAITFWPAGPNKKPLVNISRTYEHGQTGVSHFMAPGGKTGGCVDVSQSTDASISFTTCNSENTKQKGYLSFEVAIKDAVPGSNTFGNCYNSTDPHCELRSSGG